MGHLATNPYGGMEVGIPSVSVEVVICRVGGGGLRGELFAFVVSVIRRGWVRSCGRAFCPWLSPLLCCVASSPRSLTATHVIASVVVVPDRRLRARGARHIPCSMPVCQSLPAHRPPVQRVPPPSSDHSILFYESFRTLKTAVGR